MLIVLLFEPPSLSNLVKLFAVSPYPSTLIANALPLAMPYKKSVVAGKAGNVSVAKEVLALLKL